MINNSCIRVQGEEVYLKQYMYYRGFQAIHEVCNDTLVFHPLRSFYKKCTYLASGTSLCIINIKASYQSR